jgi:hypothetical protein
MHGCWVSPLITEQAASRFHLRGCSCRWLRALSRGVQLGIDTWLLVIPTATDTKLEVDDECPAGRPWVPGGQAAVARRRTRVFRRRPEPPLQLAMADLERGEVTDTGRKSGYRAAIAAIRSLDLLALTVR